ncbi:hypothetical protein [Planctomicrobium sp. SH527]|uniref:hypothetical protein n=1 Tax=Planctomicrobium sp. SH527 TaxID=3448123 RepID=UPI003F5B0EBF
MPSNGPLKTDNAEPGRRDAGHHSVPPSRRILILGASNVTLAFPIIADACLIRARPELSGSQQIEPETASEPASDQLKAGISLQGPVELFAAHGHGRSFCKRSHVLHRGLPSVLDCGIWSALELRPPVSSSWGLVTDVGNDLIYGVTVDQVVQQVHTALIKMHDLGFPITYVRPPLDRILQLSDRQYRIIKQMLFPGPTVPWKVLSQRAIELDLIVTQMATDLGGTAIKPELDWYGIDPIHIRSSQKIAAWTSILSSWPFPEPPLVRWPGWPQANRFWSQRPDERSYWSRSYQASQPSQQFNDGSTIWLY